MAEAKCVACGRSFKYQADFYTERNLAAPRRCRYCRESRRSSRTLRRGTVASTGERFCFIEEEGTGQHFYYTPTLPLGTVVSFHGSDLEPGYPRPFAHDVEVLDGTPAAEP